MSSLQNLFGLFKVKLRVNFGIRAHTYVCISNSKLSPITNSLKMATDDLHFFMFPMMAQGHMIPMVDIARILAHRGAMVTIVTTPHIANRFRSVIARSIEANLKIQLLEIQLPLAEVGLPEAYNSFDRVLSPEVMVKLFAAMELLEKPTEDLLRGLSPPPSCIISDFTLHWTMDLARRFHIPRLVFHGPGCFWQVCLHAAFTSNVLQAIESDRERFVLPGLPDRVEVTKLQITGSSKTPTPDEMGLWFRALEAEKASYGTVVNTFNALEPEYVKEMVKTKGSKVWCIGPVSLCNKDDLDVAERGNKVAINEHDYLKWLDARETGSVLYVSLGSALSLSTKQAIELGLGLESTHKPFIWCVKNETKELKTWFLEEGFEERVSDRGLVVHGWAPQVLILSHRAVGGFLTHCGWNSTLESICAGVPMITWPHFADQFLNEIFIVEILKIGVRIGLEIPESFEDGEALVKKDDVKIAVEGLMTDIEDAKQRKRRVIELAEMAKTATDEGGSSYANVSSLIQDICEGQKP